MNVSETWLFNGSSLASQVHAAAVNGHKRALLKQISGNPDLKDKEDQFGRTPLMYCILADRLDCAEVLLKTGTDVDKADHSQRTALHLAAQKILPILATDTPFKQWQMDISKFICQRKKKSQELDINYCKMLKKEGVWVYHI
uniref:Uncharacterized protein n=1 Tax=Micrurus paraensis TaxID=1970185 RepID=A0A2D4KKV9_9SAUR